MTWEERQAEARIKVLEDRRRKLAALLREAADGLDLIRRVDAQWMRVVCEYVAREYLTGRGPLAPDHELALQARLARELGVEPWGTVR